MSETTHTEPKTFLPNTVRAQWVIALEKAPLTESEQALVWTAIRYVLPPVNTEQLLRAIKVYTNDHDITLHDELIRQIQRLNIPNAALTQYTVRYPLCHAMTDPNSSKAFSSFDSPFQRDARQLMSDYFSDVDERAEPILWYQDVLPTRDVLRELVNMNIHDAVLQPVDRGIMSLINQHLMTSSSYSDRFKGKCKRVMRLFAGINKIGTEKARKPGMREHEKSSRTSGLSRRGAQPSVTNELTKQLHDTIQTQQRQRKTTHNRRDASVDTKTASVQSFTVYRKPLSPKAIVNDLGLSSTTYTVVEQAKYHDANDDQSLTVTRKTPSTLTRQDDQVLIKKANHQAATDYLTSLTDIQRLTAGQIASLLLDIQETPDIWAFCLLLLSTGLPYKRLVSLTRCEEMPESYPATNETLFWNANNEYLWYALLDGPSSDDDNLNKQVVLKLPTALNQALIASAAQRGVDTPLSSAPNALKRYTQSQKKTLTGLLPTPARLTASAPLLIRSYAQDETAQLALSGRFGVQNGAKAAYRALLPGELNRLFNDVLTTLNGHLSCSNAHETDDEGRTHADSDTPRFKTTREACEPTTVIPDAASLLTTVPEEITHHQPGEWLTGSLLAAHPRQFNAWFEGLDNAISETLTRFTLVLSPRKRPVKEACTLSRLLACRAYLLLLLSTGCRPHGPNTRYCLLDKQLWIADKDSPHYRESRVIPAVPALIKTLKQHELLLNSMTQWLKKRGGNVIDLRTDNQAIGYLQTRSKKAQQYVITSIEHRDFQQTLEKHLPNNSDDSASIRVRNVTRHSVATHLRTILPAPIVDGLLGHTGSGVRPTTPESIARPHERTSFTAAIENLLQQAQASTFNTKGVLHVFTE